MKKGLFFWGGVILAMGLLSWMFSQCTKTDDFAPAPLLEVQTDGISTFDPGVLDRELFALMRTELSEEEAAALFYIREEERLNAELCYLLFKLHGSLVMQELAQAERNHAHAVKQLIDYFRLPDPDAEPVFGQYLNREFQQLFDNWRAMDWSDRLPVLSTCAWMAERSYFDLDKRLDHFPHNKAVGLVFNELQEASANHLRTLVWKLRRHGSDYFPAYLDQATFDSIVGTPPGGGKAA